MEETARPMAEKYVIRFLLNCLHNECWMCDRSSCSCCSSRCCRRLCEWVWTCRGTFTCTLVGQASIRRWFGTSDEDVEQRITRRWRRLLALLQTLQFLISSSSSSSSASSATEIRRSEAQSPKQQKKLFQFVAALQPITQQHFLPRSVLGCHRHTITHLYYKHRHWTCTRPKMPISFERRSASVKKTTISLNTDFTLIWIKTLF